MSNICPQALSEILRQLLGNPAIAALVNTFEAMEFHAPPATIVPSPSDTPTAVGADASTKSIAPTATPSAELLGVPNPEHVPSLEPSIQGRPIPEKSDVPPATKGAKSQKLLRLQALESESKAPRRSTRGHMRQLGPDLTIYVIEDAVSAETPATKLARKGDLPPRCLVDSSTTADVESSSPQPKSTEDPNAAEKSASSPSQTLRVFHEDAAYEAAINIPATQRMDEDDFPLNLVMSNLRRRNIRAEKRVVDSDVAVAIVASSNPDIESEGDLYKGQQRSLNKVHSTNFYTKKALKLWPKLSKAVFYSERNIDKVSFGTYNLVEFLKSRNLLKSVTELQPYFPTAIQIVYSNLSPAFGDINNRKYGKLYYRRRVYRLTPELINELLETPNVQGTKITDYDEVAAIITG